MPLPGSELNVQSMVGPFRVLAPLGQGGTSTVYLAERVGSFRQRVAIKLLHETPGAAAALDEPMLLASLDHAHIVRLLDQGSTESGRRYLVMEFVDGVPLDLYCEAEALSTRARVELLIQLLSAVDYAHRHLVVHADIKPANILVDKAGTPKLLDFGVGAAGGSLTPAFASPEQLDGARVTAATDIYSLGLVAQAVLGSGALPHDLRLILDKATRAEPAGRYRSAREFEDDLQALLDRRPVQARAGSGMYRMGLWTRRHRTAAAMAACVLAVLGVSVAGVTVQTVRAVRERKIATVRLHDAVRLTGSLDGELYESVQPLAQGGPASASLLDAAARSLDSVAEDVGEDSALAVEVGRQYGKLALLEQRRDGGQAAAAADRAKGLRLLGRVRRSDANFGSAQAEMGALQGSGKQ